MVALIRTYCVVVSLLHADCVFSWMGFFSSHKLFNYRTRHINYDEALRHSSLILRSSVLDQESAEIDEFIGFLPTIDSKKMNISASNPFGPPVYSISQCRNELLSILRKQTLIEEGPFYHYRIEYLTKYLEAGFIPAQTIAFLQLILSGEWLMAYSNVLTPRADQSL